MSRKVKLKKLKSAEQGTKSDREFVAESVSMVPVDAVLDPAEEEVTTLAFLNAAKAIKKIDQKAFRSGLQRLDELLGGAAGMSAAEKTLVGHTFSFSNPADLIAEFPDVRDRINNGYHDFHAPAVLARERRFEYGASIIYNTVAPAAADVVIDKFTTPQTANNISLWTSFVKFGKEGSAFGDADYFIMDYVKSTGSFVGAGLSEDITGNLQAVPNNLTVAEILNAIENALIEGIFEIP